MVSCVLLFKEPWAYRYAVVVDWANKPVVPRELPAINDGRLFVRPSSGARTAAQIARERYSRLLRSFEKKVIELGSL